MVSLFWSEPEGTEHEKSFSEHYACAECGFSMPEPEPRLFSFNSPYGACPECTGLGTKTEFDPAKIITDPALPLRDGAIRPFVYKSGETKEWWPDVLDGVGRACGFDASLPVAELTEEQMAAVWNGLPDRVEVNVQYGKTSRTFKTQWNGVLDVLQKKYASTESEWVRADLNQYRSTKPCGTCQGKRLKPESLSVTLPAGSGEQCSISDLAELTVGDANDYFAQLPERLDARQRKIGERAIKEVQERLRFLVDVGLIYLTLDRAANTLAGGEAQRIRLATQIGSGLMGCLYILDEPSIGLHQRDNAKLIQTLLRLRNLGNTVIVVEHDEETMRAADWLIDLGPGGGEHGGHVVNEGPLQTFLAKSSPTSDYLNGTEHIQVPSQRRQPRGPHPAETTHKKNGSAPKARARVKASGRASS